MAAAARTVEILVCDGDPGHDWVGLFAKALPSAHVVQASWIELSVVVYSDSGCIVTAAPVRESRGEVARPATLTFKPDIAVIRNQPRGPTPGSDRRNVLLGLIAGGVPCLNSAESELMQLERPVMNGALRAIERRLGHDAFPFIAQTFYSGAREMIISPQLPAIFKVSHAHAGMGKTRIESQTAFRDLATVLALHDDCACFFFSPLPPRPTTTQDCTGEPFIEAEYGIRVQKVGKHYRVMKKVFTGSGWKSQFGGADLQEIPITDTYKRWVDECAKLWGGLDWCAVDALHGVDGKDYVIELNGSAIGFLAQRWVEDSTHVRELVLEKLASLGLI